MTKNEILIHVIITAVISTARHLTDKGEHTALHKINNDVYVKTYNDVHVHILPLGLLFSAFCHEVG